MNPTPHQEPRALTPIRGAQSLWQAGHPLRNGVGGGSETVRDHGFFTAVVGSFTTWTAAVR